MNISVPGMELTQEEQRLLEERGFLIKENIVKKGGYIFGKIYPWVTRSFFLACITFIVSVLSLEEVIGLKNSFHEIMRMTVVMVPVSLFLISPFIGLSIGLFELWKYKNMYITSKQIIFGKKMYTLGSSELRGLLEKQENAQFSFFGTLPIFGSIFILMSIIVYTIIKLNIFIIEPIQFKHFFIAYMGLILFLWLFLYYFFLKRTQIYFYNCLSLYGLRLQVIAPKIQLISKNFQNNFQEKVKNSTGFDFMRKFFDQLSKKFSEVTEIILELEKIEKKIDKGNFFDAIKYVNSLKRDILVPIINVRDLLIEQGDKLLAREIEKQKILSGENALVTHAKFQSERTSFIKKELDTNIEKLNGMIAMLEQISVIKGEFDTSADTLDVMINRLD